MSLIKPFTLDPEIDWTKVDPDARRPWYLFFTHDDAKIEDEFTRFMYRDPTSVIVALSYGLFVLAWVGASIMPVKDVWWQAMVYGLASMTLMCGIADAIIFFACEHSLQWVTTRKWLTIIIAFGASTIPSIGLKLWYKDCDESRDLMGLMFDRPSMASACNSTVPKEQCVYYIKYCVDIVEPWSFLASMVVISALRLKSINHFIQSVLHFILYMLGYFFVEIEAANFTTTLLLHILAVMSTIGFGLIREAQFRSQFAQTVFLEMRAREAAGKSEEIDTLLCEMVPQAALPRLMDDTKEIDTTVAASVIFTDVVNFTNWSSRRRAKDVAYMLNCLYIEYDKGATSLGIEKIKTIGDAYWAVSGLPEVTADHADRALTFGKLQLALTEAANEVHPQWGGIQLRIGVHSGELAGGISGQSQLSYEVFGTTTHIAEAVEQHAYDGTVCMSNATYAITNLPADESYEPRRFDLFGEHITVHVLKREKKGESSHALHRQPSGTFGRGESKRIKKSTSQSKRRFSIMSVRSVTTTGVECESIDGDEELSAEDPQSGGRGRSYIKPLPIVVQKQTSDEAERERRAAFIAMRAAKRGAKMPSVTKLAEMIAAVGRRRYPLFTLRFDDDDAEQAYERFAVTKTIVMRRYMRSMNLLFNLIIFISTFIQGIELAPQIPAVVLLSCSAAVAVGPVICGFSESIFAEYADVALAHISALLGIVGAGLLGRFSDDALVGNDVTYMATMYGTFIQLGTFAMGYGLLSLSYYLLLMPVTLYFAWDSLWLASDIMYFMFAGAQIVFTMYLSERRLREEYLESYAAEQYANVAAEQTNGQIAILETIVPPFVIPELLQWLATDLDTAAGIVVDYQQVAIAFVRFLPSETTTLASNMNHEQESLSLASSTRVEHSQLVSFVFADEEESPPVAKPKKNVAKKNAGFANPKLQAEWIIAVQNKADDILEQFPAVTKIKTVGDIVIFAGGVDRKTAIGEASEQVARAALALQDVADTKGGMHVGPLVGGVMGTTRLSFDVFGDTVNTAARVMTGAEIGQFCLTEKSLEFLRVVPVSNYEHSASGSGIAGHSLTGPTLTAAPNNSTLTPAMFGDPSTSLGLPGFSKKEEDEDEEVVTMFHPQLNVSASSAMNTTVLSPKLMPSSPSTTVHNAPPTANHNTRKRRSGRDAWGESSQSHSHLSSESREHRPLTPADYPYKNQTIMVGPRFERVAKGKGTLAVREVIPFGKILLLSGSAVPVCAKRKKGEDEDAGWGSGILSTDW